MKNKLTEDDILAIIFYVGFFLCLLGLWVSSCAFPLKLTVTGFVICGFSILAGKRRL